MKRPSFQFYPGDWLSSPAVMLMTPEQEAAYLRLLCYDWMSDGIPDDDASLAVLSRLGEGWFNHASRVIRSCFNQHPSKSGFLTNPRLQSEREKQDEWREKSRLGGIKSAKSRACKASRVVQPKVNRTVEPKGNSSTSSSSSNITPIVPKGTDGESLPKSPLPERWRNIPKIDRRNHRVLFNTETMERIGKWFNRRQGTLWTLAEGIALDLIRPQDEDLDELESYYLADIPREDYRRRDLLTLLNNWNGELDRARLWKAENS